MLQSHALNLFSSVKSHLYILSNIFIKVSWERSFDSSLSYTISLIPLLTSILAHIWQGYVVIYAVLPSSFTPFLAASLIASCSAQKKYEKYAEDIRVAEAKGEAKTYAEVVDKLGAPTVNFTASLGGSGENGYCIWYADCASMDDVDAKLEAGKEVPYIRVTFSGGKAVDAKTGVDTPKAE